MTSQSFFQLESFPPCNSLPGTSSPQSQVAVIPIASFIHPTPFLLSCSPYSYQWLLLIPSLLALLIARGAVRGCELPQRTKLNLVKSNLFKWHLECHIQQRQTSNSENEGKRSPIGGIPMPLQIIRDSWRYA